MMCLETAGMWHSAKLNWQILLTAQKHNNLWQFSKFWANLDFYTISKSNNAIPLRALQSQIVQAIWKASWRSNFLLLQYDYGNWISNCITLAVKSEKLSKMLLSREFLKCFSQQYFKNWIFNYTISTARVQWWKFSSYFSFHQKMLWTWTNMNIDQ